MKQELKVKFSGKERVMKGDIWNKTFVHNSNYHKVRFTVYDSPTPWLGNAVGKHPIPFTFIQAYCETCKEAFKSIEYLDRFDYYTGECEEKPPTEIELREEVKKINEADKILKSSFKE